tara:strand:- start:1397 stop:2131 length:735 start_codon:yes stop_codon:yes gene_type:complete
MPNISIERLSRRNQNIKQDKLLLVNIHPSVSTMREGEEVLYQGKNKPLRRYRKQNGILWYSDMTRDGNEFVDKNLKVEKNIISNGNLQLNNIPIFEAYSTGQTDLGVGTGSITQIQFASEKIDNTSSFASHNFVAPVEGYYYLYYNVSFNQIDTAMDEALLGMKQGSAYFNVSSLDDKDYSADTDSDINKSASCVRSLAVGDTIGVYWLQISGSAQVDVVAHREAGTSPYPATSVFGGYLISTY